MKRLLTAFFILGSMTAMAGTKECEDIGGKKVCGYLSQNGSILTVFDPTVIYKAYWRDDGLLVENVIKSNKSGAKLICSAFNKIPTGNNEKVATEVYYNAKTGEHTMDAGFAPIYNPKSFSKVECK